MTRPSRKETSIRTLIHVPHPQSAPTPKLPGPPKFPVSPKSPASLLFFEWIGAGVEEPIILNFKKGRGVRFLAGELSVILITLPPSPMIIHYLDWTVFGRENLSPGCPPFLASELAVVVPCRENVHSAHSRVTLRHSPTPLYKLCTKRHSHR